MDKELISAFKEVFENPNFAASIPVVFETYKPLLYSVCSEVFNIYKDYVNNDEVYDVWSNKLWNTYDALVNKGFTKTQAFQILLNDITNTNNIVRNMSSSINNKKE